MRLEHLTEAELLRYYRVAYALLEYYESDRAFQRLAFIVAEMDTREQEREIVYE